MTDTAKAAMPGTQRNRPAAVLLVLTVGIGALYVLSGRGGQIPEGWLIDLDLAKRQAAETHKLLFVNFSADWCAPCRMMKREVFPDPRVREALADYVSVHIDVDGQPETARQYGVYSLPTLVVMDPEGAVLARWDGGMPADQLLHFLKSAPRAG